MKASIYLSLSTIVLYGSQREASAVLNCSVVSEARAATGQASVSTCDFFQGVDFEAYLNWYDKSDVASKYPNQEYLLGSDPAAPENGAAIHWRVDEEYVYIAVAARATGWLAFGISEAGGMLGSDLVMFTAARPNELVDAYVGDERYPQIDDCAGDWEMVASNVDTDGGFIMFETKRLLNTNDPQDKPIVDDAATIVPAHRIIAAWGDSEEVGYHGLNRARGTVRFFGTADDQSTFKAAMQSAEGSFEVRATEYTIPDVETTYAYFCVSRDDLIDQGVLNTTDSLNVIGWDPIVQAGNEAYVHHFVVTGSSTQKLCPEDPSNRENFTEIAYVWAPGEKGFALPDNFGAPLFGDDGFQAYNIEIHYNNPTLDAGIVDSSGVRIYWTSEAREWEVGIMTVGDPNIGLFGQLVGAGLTRHEFDCPSSCSSLVNQEVTVLREYLHMHKAGARMTNEQIRGDEVLREGHVEYWEFDQNGNSAVQQQPFVVKPGDGFRTTCYFEDKEGSKVFGLGSSQEMCMAFLYYYPRTTIDIGGSSLAWMCGYNLGFEACEANHTATNLEDKAEFNREFAIANNNCTVQPDTDPVDDGNDETSSSVSYGNVLAMSLAGVIGIIGAIA